MLSLIISLIVGTAAILACHFGWPGHPDWTATAGVVGFLGSNAVISLILRKRMMTAFQSVQNAILEDQAVLRRKANALQGRAGMGMMEKLEQEQNASVRRALKMLDTLKPFEKWNFLVKKQTDALRAQFHFQLKEYEQADKCLRGAMLMDPQMIAIQMTRYYKLGEEKKLVSCYQKGIRRFKDERGAIIYGLYSWILVQQKKIDEAIQVLVDAKQKIDHPVLKQNWESLVNGKTNRFSNAGFGEVWYSLQLEQPRIQRIQQPQGFRR